VDSGALKEARIRRVQIPHAKGEFWGGGAAHCKVWGLSAVSCTKRLNRSRRPLGCGLWCVQGSMC